MVFPDTYFPFSGKLREKCPNTDTVRIVESTEMKVNISINFVKLLMFFSLSQLVLGKVFTLSRESKLQEKFTLSKELLPK